MVCSLLLVGLSGRFFVVVRQDVLPDILLTCCRKDVLCKSATLVAAA
jgi:hypothetical protein